MSIIYAYPLICLEYIFDPKIFHACFSVHDFWIMLFGSCFLIRAKARFGRVRYGSDHELVTRFSRLVTSLRRSSYLSNPIHTKAQNVGEFFKERFNIFLGMKQMDHQESQNQDPIVPGSVFKTRGQVLLFNKVTEPKGLIMGSRDLDFRIFLTSIQNSRLLTFKI